MNDVESYEVHFSPVEVLALLVAVEGFLYAPEEYRKNLLKRFPPLGRELGELYDRLFEYMPIPDDFLDNLEEWPSE